ncbi:hypothetical protein ACERII_19450 [Evansella sp. AB-rgal1]|uniref:hypothetical protein n=1 Tax=Evansella sp. AB-rgal1 TaxID=3242696 RepID=UPI00359E28C2
MKRTIIFVLCVVLFIAALLLFNPYNLYHHIKAEETVSRIFADPNIKETVFADSSEITNIRYLGSNMYRGEISNMIFLMEIKKDGSRTSYEIYEFKQRIESIGY